MKKALFLVFVILLCSLAISSSVTRTVSTSVPQGSDFYVTITAIVTSPDTIIAIDETLPTVFSIVDGNGGEGGQAYHLKWIETEAAGTIVYKYKLNAGNTPGTYTFSGKYIAENDTVEKSIIGNTSITVLEGTPICTAAHWKDTNGPCQEGNKLTTTWEQTTTCHDGVQHDPTEIQDCIYTPTCLDFNYTSWAPATCPSTEEQTRDITTKTPANCQGGNPILTQTCIYTPTCTEEHWTDTNTECQDNNTLTTTWAHTSCTGGIFHASPQIQACDYNTPTCIDFNYSLWTPSTCPLGGIQTRTITSTTPTVCQGGHPIKTRTCTYTPTCTIQDHWTSSDGNCQSNNFLTRTWTKTGTCLNGETPTSPEEISCNYNAQVCEAFTYSPYGSCQQVSGSIGIKSRDIASKLPLGCEGGSPDLTADCNFITTCTDSYWTYSLGSCDNNTQIKTWKKTADCNGGISRPETEIITCNSNTPPVKYCGSDDWDSRIEPEVCPSNGLQTRHWTRTNLNCQGGLTKLPQESITCTPQGATCTSFTYSNWSNCSSSGNQTRTVLTSTPSNCTGGNPTLSQTCTPNITGCAGATCGDNCYTEEGICCNNNWNSRESSCDFPIGEIILEVEESNNQEAIDLIKQAEISIQNGEMAKGKAQAALALLKSKTDDYPELNTVYEDALVALNEGKYKLAEQLSINATNDIDSNQLAFSLDDPLTQIILVIVILAIIVMGIIVLGRKRPKRKKPIKEEVNDPFSLEKEDLLKNLRDEFN